MTTVLESLLSLEKLTPLFGFTQYDEEGYPIDSEFGQEEELEEDLDDGFDDETLDKDETEWE